MDDVSAVLVDGRGRSRTVALFNMRCDGQQIPEQLDGTKTRMYRARATFTGQAAPWNEGSPGGAGTCLSRGQGGSRGRRGTGYSGSSPRSRGRTAASGSPCLCGGSASWSKVSRVS